MKPRVLIVDDEANIRRMLAALLRSEGFETEEAPNGNAALLQLDQLHPDAVLLDLQMPPGPTVWKPCASSGSGMPGFP
jgi:CheY-like chemotaxis protein